MLASGQIVPRWGRVEVEALQPLVDALDPAWSSLIQRTLDERAAYWAEPTAPGLAEATVAFGEYVLVAVAGRVQ